MKKNTLLLFLFFTLYTSAQDLRIQQLKNNLEAINDDAPGLTEKINVNIKESSLSSFLLAVSEVHKINISIDATLSKITIVNNFKDVIVQDLLIFLCKEYNLTIDFTGNILAIKNYTKPPDKTIVKTIELDYNYNDNLLSLNLKEDKLYDVFKKITDESGKNLVFAPGLENHLVTGYIKNTPFDIALEKLAYANNLSMIKSRDNFYVFDYIDGNYSPESTNDKSTSKQTKPVKARKSNFYFNVVDKEKKIIDVDLENTPISNIIYDIGNELEIDMFISSPLEEAGNATVKAKNITFDDLLTKIFQNSSESKGALSSTQQSLTNESTASQASSFNFMKSENIYYFGKKNQLAVRNIVAIPLMHRSIELMSDPSKDGRSSGRLNNSQTFNSLNSQDNRNGSNLPQSNYSPAISSSSQSILTIIPDEIKADLDIKIDRELNSFIVNGPSANIDRFVSFIKYIDKPVPVILIEVMLLEVNRSATVETGIKAGLGTAPAATGGTVYPTSDITLGATTINNIINYFDGFGSLNIGKVLPNFYFSLKAMESNGNLRIRSAPRLSTLNGHKAYLSIGETTYYVVTSQNFYGSQIPQTSEIKNYQPVDAELSVSIMPLVSGDGQITLDIKVVQSSFNGQRVDNDAPPGINSREFTSIIRVRDQELIVLGGLEEKVKNDTGTGVPLLARIPILKWLFSSRKRDDSKKKLTVLIKPTVLY